MICIAKQTLIISTEAGVCIKNHNYNKYMAFGGKIIGNVRALCSYEFENKDGSYIVYDDAYSEIKILAPMEMSPRCFNKYFIVVQDDDDGRDSEAEKRGGE
jgi:hypothetical protein